MSKLIRLYLYGGNSTTQGRLTVRASLKQEAYHVYGVYTAFEGDIEKRPTKKRITVRPDLLNRSHGWGWPNLESVAKRYAFVIKGSEPKTTVTFGGNLP